MAPPPSPGGRPLLEAGLISVFAARRARPSPAEPRRTEPNVDEPARAPGPGRLRCPSAAERTSGCGRGGGAAPRGGGTRSPQTARSRGRPGRAAAGAAGGGCAAEGEGRGRGRLPCPPPPPPARKLASLSLHPASRCRGSSRGCAPGSTQAQDCRWMSSQPRNH
ncbi:adropin isoform X1 [Erinaceus europaeus]|uniref:Adropin isoform X1 n=1 Tax=Erinaceus europaeus TaxID=9365 RepID=A0ABM3Y2E9_ERIEU|nr:adropin isoform X1 [Erinaceus europaeus]